MLDYQLFLGFPLHSTYQISLEKSSPALRNLFIQNNSDYLCQIEYKGIVYLGKPAGSIVDVQRLESLEENIYSLLRRLVPEYAYEQTPLLLFPISS